MESRVNEEGAPCPAGELGSLFTHLSKGEEHLFSFVACGLQKDIGDGMESPSIPRGHGMMVWKFPTICCR